MNGFRELCSYFLHFLLLSTEKYNFLGISIVGQSNDRGDGGIYIGSIMKGGAVAADGRIEPGDMLLQVRTVETSANFCSRRALLDITDATVFPSVLSRPIKSLGAVRRFRYQALL